MPPYEVTDFCHRLYCFWKERRKQGVAMNHSFTGSKFYITILPRFEIKFFSIFKQLVILT